MEELSNDDFTKMNNIVKDRREFFEFQKKNSFDFQVSLLEENEEDNPIENIRKNVLFQTPIPEEKKDENFSKIVGDYIRRINAENPLVPQPNVDAEMMAYFGDNKDGELMEEEYTKLEDIKKSRMEFLNYQIEHRFEYQPPKKID